MKRLILFFAVAGLNTIAASALFATDPPPLAVEQLIVNGDQKNLRFAPYPGAQAYYFFSTTNLLAPFVLNPNFQLAPYITGYTTNLTTNGPVTITNLAYEWRITNFPGDRGFFSLAVAPSSSNTLLAATVMNRLAYGPTPDELPVVLADPQSYINQQLAMEGIPEPMDNYTVETGNAIPSDPTANWVSINLTGTVATTTFYLFTTQPGDVFLDDIELRPFIYMKQIVTNVVNGTNVIVTNSVFSHIGTNVLINGGFESGYASWTNAGGAAGSGVDSSKAHSGSRSLHMISTTGATAPGSSYVRQGFRSTYVTTNTLGNVLTNTYASTNPVVLTCWYLPSTNSTKLRLQLGSGLNSTPGGIPATPTWVYATASGVANANSRLYLYLSGAGECYLDDIKLVAGGVPEVGGNLLANGGFESPLAGTWTSSSNFINSTLSSTIAHSGNSSLRLVATAAGAGNTNSTQQNITPALTNGKLYTVSYWYRPGAPGVTLTVRLDGSFLQSTPDRDTGGLYRRLQTFQAALGDYRAWFCLHAVNAQRQLFEILSQFWENHFVTQYTKSREHVDNLGLVATVAGYVATDWEFREMTKWRNAMLNPQCTFYDLLKISAESPAMIVYLDTVNSKGNGNNVANENFARELLELFTYGVDNGYDQNDILLMSRAWTGWSVQLVDAVNASNPFAPESVTYYPGTNSIGKENTIGVWAFNFKSGDHGTNRGALFAGKTVPARFGPPWAGNNYQLSLPARLTGTTNGIQDGYDVIAHLANQPFTQEHVCVKLCRLFVHDDFPNPTTITDQPAYAFYDYTNPDRSPEAELVHQCMLAWENSTPKGNLRAVLRTIFNSDLFRSHTANAQKIKTPLEFVASSVRALKSTTSAGAPTAFTDGFSFASPLALMGGMNLFDRSDPDGYPETAPGWISAGTLVERIRHVQALCNAGNGDDAGNHTIDPVGLLTKKSISSTSASAVADYFLGLLYPAEGAANLALYRAAAINFLNTDDGGKPSALSASNADTRIRGMVAMLLTFQRFQEQ